ncbi:MAG: indolepyruvate oxidoreductase subunit beta [Bacillota bacterium]|jgi:indolepyruvate ferredoxin oxidoreductase beta subunit
MKTTSKTTNVLIVGVGGQGTILSGRIISEVVLAAGLDVKVSEIHGMSQRGGSVITQVRFGEKVWSPIIPNAQADVMIAFEKLEALRSLNWMSPDGQVIVNDRELYPMPVISGAMEYPADIKERVFAKTDKAIFLDALSMAVEAGNPKSLNLVLLGCLSMYMSFSQEAWERAIAAVVKPHFLEVNLKAFSMGREAIEKNQ